MALNPDRVIVTVTTGTRRLTLRQVDGPSACSGVQGWYHDDAEAPTRILLCDDACALLALDASLEVVVACSAV
jgi:hypothetical protein